MQNWFQINPAVWPNFPVFWIVDPIKPPKMPLCGIVGRIVFSLCPFPDESTEVYQIWCKSVQIFDSFPRLLNLWPLTPPPPPDTPPGVLRGDLYLAYTHSQMRTIVGANRSSHLTAFPGLWLFDPLKLPKCPPCVSRAICLRISIPRWIYKVGANRTSRLNLPLIFEFVTPTPPPPMSRGEFYLAYVHSQTNPQTCTKFGVNRSSPLTASQTFWFVTPKPPEMPLVSWCSLCLAYSHC